MSMARTLLAQPGCAVAAVYRGQVLGTAGGSGIRPLLELVDRLGPGLDGAAVADRVVGTGAAWLCLAAGVGAVHAVTLSEPAAALLAADGIPVTWDRRVPGILNRDRTGPCPVEAAVAHAATPEQAVAALRQLLAGAG